MWVTVHWGFKVSVIALLYTDEGLDFLPQYFIVQCIKNNRTILSSLLYFHLPCVALLVKWMPVAFCMSFFLACFSNPGFNVGRSAGGRSTVREINRDACHFPGFPVLQTFLPKHTNVPELYFLLMALFLQQPVTELPGNLQVTVRTVRFI